MLSYGIDRLLDALPLTNASGRILVIDDHPVVLYGLRLLLEHNPRFAICGEATDSASARTQAEALRPDYVILDLVLGGRDGIELLYDLLAIAPSARVLVYSSQNEWLFARRSMKAGAKGYVAKSEGLSVVAHALDVIRHRGHLHQRRRPAAPAGRLRDRCGGLE